jgi:hypothetical protein
MRCSACPTPCAQRPDLGAVDSTCPLPIPRWGSRPAVAATNHAEGPSTFEMAVNLSSAMRRWAASGLKTVSEQEYEARSAVCSACAFWDASARMGLGKCNAPGCGCTKLKLWLATEKCPIGKWATFFPDSEQTINQENNMDPQEFTKRLSERKASLQSRVIQSSEAVTMAEARLAQVRQRLALAQGELKAVSDVIADNASVADPAQSS